MRLNETDFRILDALQAGRNVAPNIALMIDADRNYINAELTKLCDFDLVDRIGPYKRSGLYSLTERGRVAAQHRDLYVEDAAAFEEVITQDG